MPNSNPAAVPSATTGEVAILAAVLVGAATGVNPGPQTGAAEMAHHAASAFRLIGYALDDLAKHGGAARAASQFRLAAEHIDDVGALAGTFDHPAPLGPREAVLLMGLLDWTTGRLGQRSIAGRPEYGDAARSVLSALRFVVHVVAYAHDGRAGIDEWLTAAQADARRAVEAVAGGTPTRSR